MFNKILIANRGEIAIRVMRTCREMGIATVMVHSTADREALHTQLAAETVCIGGPRPEDSYLNIPGILQAALSTGCDAIHPGYGFLAESAEFAELAEAAGICFIGPKAETIRRLGDKANARRLMEEAGLPTIPGSTGLLSSADEALRIAAETGYPVLLKATAGGGGRGMRRIDKPEQMEEGLQSARREAKLSFGDEGVYLEKLILNPKHLEIQILADSHGNIIQLGERDCSLQRKRQKMIEESPCSVLSDDIRQKLGEAAVKAGRAADYLGAGTVEFILSPEGEFYFMEVNTRIQVEHPVTEVLTGLDLVREQIRIASEAKLALTQNEVELRGHAIECRINAESPINGFRPSPGRIEQFNLPGGFSVRVDSAMYSGCEIPPHYDSLIAKLIVHGNSRRDAIRRMRRCLEELIIDGVDTNVGLLYVLLFENDVIRGDYNTGYVEDNMKQLLNYASLMESE